MHLLFCIVFIWPVNIFNKTAFLSKRIKHFHNTSSNSDLYKTLDYHCLFLTHLLLLYFAQTMLPTSFSNSQRILQPHDFVPKHFFSPLSPQDIHWLAFSVGSNLHFHITLFIKTFLSCRLKISICSFSIFLFFFLACSSSF